METFTEELKREYFSALYNQQTGNNEPMQRFKLSHGELYRVVNAMYHKRKIIRENIYCMREISNSPLVAGSLTYDNEHNDSSERNKRQQAVRHLNDCCDLYLFVEEHGELNDRYHIHFVGILKPLVSYSDYIKGWHSRAEIQKILSIKKAVNYLTDYVVKQVPRIRRNARLVSCFKHYKKAVSWRSYGFDKSFGQQEINDAVIELVFGL